MMKYIAVSRQLHRMQEQARKTGQKEVSDRQSSSRQAPSNSREEIANRTSR